MAYFSEKAVLKKEGPLKYQIIRKSEEITPFSGIYKCVGCGREIVSAKSNPLPPQNDHQHDSASEGEIRWQLIVRADHQSYRDRAQAPAG